MRRDAQERIRGRYLLAERAYQILHDQISYGELRGGARLAEQELSVVLGMSRTPVREALQRLEQDGLISRNGASLFVTRFDPRAALEIMSVRVLLEPVAARLSAPHLISRHVSELRAITGRMEDARQQRLGPGEHARLNTEFHDVLYEPCPHSRLVAIIEQLRGNLVAFELYSRYEEEDYQRVFEEHTRILRAVQIKNLSRRTKEVERLLRDHLTLAQQPFEREIGAVGHVGKGVSESPDGTNFSIGGVLL